MTASPRPPKPPASPRPFAGREPLSGDRIGDLDVLSHALEATEAIDRQRYDIVVMLQPTSPLRTAADVSAR